MSPFLLIRWVDRFGSQQRLLHQLHLLALRRVIIYAQVHIIGDVKVVFALHCVEIIIYAQVHIIGN